MSYGFTMAFFLAKDKAEALLKAEQFVSTAMTENFINERLKENLFRFQAMARIKSMSEWNIQKSKLLECWLGELFSIRCVYWPQHEIFAIVGDGWSKECEELAEGSVRFQNSTDQDYDFHEWPASISFFREYIELAKSMSIEGLIATANLDPDELDDEECIVYARRSFLYKKIFEALDLNRWLYDCKGAFQKFAMSGITDWYVLQDLHAKAYSMLQNM